MDSAGNTPFVDFGDVLQYYRNREGLSQGQLAEGICTRVYVSQIEQNKQIPRLHIIAAFSNRLGVNLFEVYAMILEHNDFDTHKKIEKLNEAIAGYDDKRVYELAKEYASLPGFSGGVPLQFIKYAYCLYYANVLHDYGETVSCATEGLSVSGVPDACMTPTAMLSVIDLCLLLVKSVNLCRNGKLEEGRKHLEYLHECARLRLTQNKYIANRNLRFDINLFTKTTFNICVFFPDDTVRNKMILEETIMLLQDHKCTRKQSELLLYKARYLYDTGEMDNARDCFRAGYYLLVCRKSRQIAEEYARDILEERLDKLR